MTDRHAFMEIDTGDVGLRRAVEAVRALADPSPPWAEILLSGRDLLGADGATFIVFEGRQLATFESVGNDPAAEKAYVQHFSSQDIMLEPGRPRPGGTWLDTEDKLKTIDRERSEYYVDFMCAHRMRQIHSLVLEEGHRSASVSFQRATIRDDGHAIRTSSRIGRYRQEVLAALARRNDRASDWIRMLEGAADAFDQGVLLLDAHGRVIHRCQRCAALLEQSRAGLFVRHATLGHADARVIAAFRRALAQLHAGEAKVRSLRLPAAVGGILQVEMARAPAGLRLGNESMCIARLSIEPRQEVHSSLLCAAFGLTDAEARVLGALASGETPAAHAAAHGVTVHTVRRQIATLMQKMGCNRQADLIRQVLALA